MSKCCILSQKNQQHYLRLLNFHQTFNYNNYKKSLMCPLGSTLSCPHFVLWLRKYVTISVSLVEKTFSFLQTETYPFAFFQFHEKEKKFYIPCDILVYKLVRLVVSASSWVDCRFNKKKLDATITGGSIRVKNIELREKSFIICQCIHSFLQEYTWKALYHTRGRAKYLMKKVLPVSIKIIEQYSAPYYSNHYESQQRFILFLYVSIMLKLFCNTTRHRKQLSFQTCSTNINEASEKS